MKDHVLPGVVKGGEDEVDHCSKIGMNEHITPDVVKAGGNGVVVEELIGFKL
jgi:hypothetical protein